MSAACNRACADTDTGDNATICYSCRCKQALGALPTPAELKCSLGEEIVVYRAGARVTTEVEDCENPAMLPDVEGAKACLPGSRLGQLEKGGATFKWICRRKTFNANYARPLDEKTYEDVGLIGYNPENGATCFWDDNDRGNDGEALPDIDLTDADETKVERFNAVWTDQHTDSGQSCLRCHDSDAFIRTNYLKSLRTFNNPGRGPNALYALVGSRGPFPTGLRHLTSAGAAECTGCHRIGLNETCRRFAPDSMGWKSTDEDYVRPYEARARDNDGDNVAGYRAAYWMPQARRPQAWPTGDFPANHAAWQTDYLATKQHIMTCCGVPGYDAGADAGDAGCATTAIPGPVVDAGTSDASDGGTELDLHDSCVGRPDGIYCSTLRTDSAYVCKDEQINGGYQCMPDHPCIGPNADKNGIECL